MRTGNTRSCGCLYVEQARTMNLIHGRSHTPGVYSCWSNMMKRCRGVSDPYYGGRGIKVCDRWHSFENFLADMGERPVGQTIERIDNDGDYEPSNCRWATRKEQSRNQRKNILVTLNGETLCLSEWAERLNINVGTVRSRIKRYGWSSAKALTVPLISRSARTHFQQEICASLGIRT
jgi:hypothetical protein